MSLESGINAVPAGRWAVGVSGGADSVALLRLLLRRRDLSLHVVHLDHELRGAESSADAKFVRQLAAQHGVPCTIERRTILEQEQSDLPNNPSARYRRLRLMLFQRTVIDHKLAGVLLAHHADDQAETVMQRLLRGSGPSGLTGMSDCAQIGDLVIRRPLLNVSRESLRNFLREIEQSFREDASNASPKYSRNRLRTGLQDDPALTSALLQLSIACSELAKRTSQLAPQLGETFAVNELGDLPNVLARVSARDWLAARGVPPKEIDLPVIERLIEMCRDAAAAPQQHFPGIVIVHRRRGRIS